MSRINGNNYNISRYGWLCVYLISSLEFIIDYARYRFFDKRLLFVAVLGVCVIEAIKCRAHTLRKSMCAFGIFALLLALWSKDFSYTVLGVSFLLLSLMEISATQFDIIRSICISSGIVAAIGCILQILNPSLLYSIGSVFLNSLWLEETRKFAGWGMYAGFTYQTGTTANLIVIAIISLLSKRADTAKLKRIIFIVILYIGLILTAKRMLLIIALIIPFVSSLCNTKANNGKITNKLLGLLIASIAMIVVFSAILPNLSNITVIKRFFYSDSALGFDSGRNDLYQIAWGLYKTNPVFGIGWGNFSQASGSGTSVHSVFIQLLCETGLVGFVLWLIVAGESLFTVLDKVKKLYLYTTEDQCILIFSLLVQLYFLLYCFSGNPLYNISSRSIYFFACVIGHSSLFSENDYVASVDW